ncbi:MAG TPA: hypothetical protein VFO40_05385 [Chthoniobacterales bacterium]|nr:hypothetical protein [Chthoniobacterales bacterium]
MKGFVFLGLLLVSATGLADQPRGTERDYVVTTAHPYKGEIELGQKRLDKFLRRLNSSRRALLDQTPYVAIQVRALTAGDVPWLVNRFYRGSARSTDFAKDLDDARSVPVQYLLIFDSRTGKMVNEDGVLVTDTPRRDSIARFGSLHAIYAGTVPGW